jgi:hypothetical protein
MLAIYCCDISPTRQAPTLVPDASHWTHWKTSSKRVTSYAQHQPNEPHLVSLPITKTNGDTIGEAIK